MTKDTRRRAEGGPQEIPSQGSLVFGISVGTELGAGGPRHKFEEFGILRISAGDSKLVEIFEFVIGTHNSFLEFRITSTFALCDPSVVNLPHTHQH